MFSIAPLTLLLLFVFLDVFGFALLLPLIPHYAEHFGNYWLYVVNFAYRLVQDQLRFGPV